MWIKIELSPKTLK